MMTDLQAIEAHFQSEENMYDKLMLPYQFSQLQDKLDLVYQQQEKAIPTWRTLVPVLQNKIFSLYYTTNALIDFIHDFKQEIEKIAGGYGEDGRLVNPFEVAETQKYCTGEPAEDGTKSGQLALLEQKLQQYDTVFLLHGIAPLDRTAKAKKEAEENLPSNYVPEGKQENGTLEWNLFPAVFCIHSLLSIEYDVREYQYKACQMFANINWMFLEGSENSRMNFISQGKKHYQIFDKVLKPRD